MGSLEPAKKKQIWVIDDEMELAESYALFLQDSYETKLFLSAEEALIAFDREARPEVVISDLKMPGMDGLSLAESIRKTSAETPVIMLSGFAERSHLVKAINTKIFSFIDKPCDPELLKNKVVEAINWKNNMSMMNQLIIDLRAQSQNYSAISQHFSDRYTYAENRLDAQNIPLFDSPEDIQTFMKRTVTESSLMRQIDEKQAKIDKLIYKLVIRK